jgi:hypothetical protein
MGHPDGAHTHGSGSSGLGTAVLVLVGAALVVKLAAPVAAAVGELVHILLIAVAVIGGLAAAGGIGLLALRLRHSRENGITRVAFPAPTERRAAQAPTEPRREIESGGLHLHLYGISAEEVADIIERHRQDRT